MIRGTQDGGGQQSANCILKPVLKICKNRPYKTLYSISLFITILSLKVLKRN